MSVDTVMFAEERVNEEDAFKMVRERMMRMVFMKGFFKLSRVNVEIKLAASLHLPYWVGVYDRQGRAHLEIINALQGRFRGSQAARNSGGMVSKSQLNEELSRCLP